MSLIPFILDLADELNEFNRSLVSGMDVDDFGFGMYPNELPQSSPRRPRTVSQLYLLPNTRGRHHPYWRGSGTSSKACCNKAADKEVAGSNDKESSVAVKPATAAYSVVNKNGFQVSMNVKQFSPNELTVKTIDNCIVVEGQHDEKEDGHGVISRHFVRKYMLPKGFDPNEVLSTLSSDGILTVKAPPPTKAEEQQLERIVHIQHTGPAQLAAKDVGSSGNKEKTQQQQQQQQQQPQQTLVTAATTTTQTPKQQQQQQQQQKQNEEEIQNVVNERNGDANANEINPESETATEAASIEPMLLVSNVVTAAAIDAIVTASVTAVAAANEENKNDVEHENDTNDADIPMVDVAAIPAGVIESVVVVVDATAVDAAAEDGAVDGAAAATAAAEIDGDTPADEIIIPTPPTAGDLVAAADAAILLAKTQCENGTKAAAEELAN